MKKAKLTISRPTGTKEPYIAIKLEDSANYNRLIEVHVPLEDFAMALTGLGNVEVDLDYFAVKEAVENLGKKKEIIAEGCEKVWTTEEQREIIKKDFNLKYDTSEWKMLSDGTSTQQNGKQHYYTVYRYKN